MTIRAARDADHPAIAAPHAESGRDVCLRREWPRDRIGAGTAVRWPTCEVAPSDVAAGRIADDGNASASLLVLTGSSGAVRCHERLGSRRAGIRRTGFFGRQTEALQIVFDLVSRVADRAGG